MQTSSPARSASRAVSIALTIDGETVAGVVYDALRGDLFTAADVAAMLAELDLAQLRRTRTRLPMLRDERPEVLLRELQRIMK